MVKREEIHEDEFSDDEFFSAEEVASYKTEEILKEENKLEERLQGKQDMVIIDE